MCQIVFVMVSHILVVFPFTLEIVALLFNLNCVINFLIDIEECESGLSDCEQKCVNVQGGYNCNCYAGYILTDDRKSCQKQGNLFFLTKAWILIILK